MCKINSNFKWNLKCSFKQGKWNEKRPPDTAERSSGTLVFNLSLRLNQLVIQIITCMDVAGP